jgi:hypothetical protein
VFGRVTLGKTTGICPVTNTKQRLVLLDEDERNQIRDDLLQLAEEAYTKTNGRSSKDKKERASIELRKFADWLE